MKKYVNKSYMSKHFRDIDGKPHISTWWAARLMKTTKQTITNWMADLLVRDISETGYARSWVPLDEFIFYIENKFNGWQYRTTERYKGGWQSQRPPRGSCFLTRQPITLKNRKACINVIGFCCPFYDLCEEFMPVTDILEKILRAEGEKPPK